MLAALLEGRAVPIGLAILVALAAAASAGPFNGFWVAFVGLPSLAVTLAGLIGFRGAARILVEDRSVGGFPDWFTASGSSALIGPLPLSLILFAVLASPSPRSSCTAPAFGRTVYVIGNNAEVARFSGVSVARVKMSLFIASATVAALAGVLLSRRGSARCAASTAEGFELDIITIVLLGGVSIFGGSGNHAGVLLSILIWCSTSATAWASRASPATPRRASSACC